MSTITANDLYALGLALGAILRDVDPVKRDRALDLVRTLEAQAAGETGRPVDYHKLITARPGLTAEQRAELDRGFGRQS